MKKLLLLAGAAALLGASPAIAKEGPKAKPGPVQVQKVKVQKVLKVKPIGVRPVSANQRSWLTACPPGLIWRGTVCVPPGHAKRVLGVGTRVPNGWAYTPWGAVPLDLRTRYELDPAYRYIYRDNMIYVVNPETRLITSILDAVL